MEIEDREAMRTPSGAPSAAAREKHGGKKGEFPVFDHKSAMSALKLRGHADDPAKIIAKVRAWAREHDDKAVLAAADAAAENDRKSDKRDDDDIAIEFSMRAPVEFREAHVESVDYPQRTITVIVTPYDTPTQVEYRGQIWDEMFERGALDGVKNSPHRVRVNRGHDRMKTVGKAVNFYPERREGLVSDIYIAKTTLGDETLALAADDCLSASAGFACTGQHLDHRNKLRRVSKAHLDHIAMVESPAYRDARVLAVRGDAPPPEFKPFPATPNLDLFTNDEILRWASERLNPK